MSEDSRDPLAELLSSPLERRPDRIAPPATGPGKARSGLPVLASMALGALIVVAGFAVGRSGTDSPAPATSTTVATTTTVATVAGFPEDYVPVTALLAVRAERVSTRDDSLFITFSVAALASLDPTLSEPFEGGEWELTLAGGRTIEASGSILDQFVPGVFTVVFPVDGYTSDDLVSVRLTERWNRNNGFPTEAFREIGSLPFTAPADRFVELDAQTNLVVERMELTDDGGVIDWRLDGVARGAITTLAVNLAEGFNDFTPATMRPVSSTAGFVPFQPAFVPSLSDQTTSGTIALTPPGLEPGTQLFEIEVLWNVTWTTAVPSDVTIPLERVHRDG